VNILESFERKIEALDSKINKQSSKLTTFQTDKVQTNKKIAEILIQQKKENEKFMKFENSGKLQNIEENITKLFFFSSAVSLVLICLLFYVVYINVCNKKNVRVMKILFCNKC
jgi:hypothetical protein